MHLYQLQDLLEIENQQISPKNQLQFGGWIFHLFQNQIDDLHFFFLMPPQSSLRNVKELPITKSFFSRRKEF